MLPPNVADVETDLGGFRAQGGTTLAIAAADTAFGKKALSVAMSVVPRWISNEAGQSHLPLAVVGNEQSGLC